MIRRTITAAFIVAFVFPLLYLGGWYTAILATLFVGGGIYEVLHVKDDIAWPWYFRTIIYVFSFMMFYWLYIINFLETGVFAAPTGYSVQINIIFVAMYLMTLFFTEVTTKSIKIIDVFYVFTITLVFAVAGQAFMFTRQLGFNAAFYVLFTNFMSDAFAYYFGLRFGKHKLAPIISPKKTWEGAIAGVVMAALLGTFVFGLLPFGGFPTWLMLLVSAALGIGAIIGDLIFSSIKRYFGLKDFGVIFPGHGGILDRVDSLLFNLMAFLAMIALITGGVFI
jgi:phosphatidate cytidylyltransferase